MAPPFSPFHQIAFVSGILRAALRLMTGDPMTTVAKRLESLYELAGDCGQTIHMRACSGMYIFILDHMRKSASGLTACGMEAYDEDAAVHEGINEGRTMWQSTYYHFKLFAASYYRNSRSVELYARKINTLLPAWAPKAIMPIYEFCYYFHRGLTAAARVREGKRWQLRKLRRYIRLLTAEIGRCPENIQHKAKLLEAELLAVTGKMDEAVCLYEESIQYANKAQFVNEEALANEKAGNALAGIGKEDRAVLYLMKAFELYEAWGAEGKVAEMKAVMGKLNVKVTEGLDGSSMQF
jgi:tetratricopeptide (TPR) repeat protein